MGVATSTYLLFLNPVLDSSGPRDKHPPNKESYTHHKTDEALKLCLFTPSSSTRYSQGFSSFISLIELNFGKLMRVDLGKTLMRDYPTVCPKFHQSPAGCDAADPSTDMALARVDGMD